ncbi:YceI family protein [Xanthomonas sp. MUS 060]|uniref:YceI family protein n=1 Tax=Xanthomonas sp. MUS 060 TaxID=1588031 RepID=UPI0005F2FC6C|nr:YceI family protein [Xanthomonas sp. MUS 060]
MFKHCLVVVLLALPGTGLAAPAQYALDPVHTRVLFAIDHAGFSKALGTVSGSTGTLVFDPQDWRSARLQARVPLQRLDLGDDAWNRAALARNLLDGKHYPEALFVSTRIEPVDARHAKVIGQLTLHGVSREVTLEVTMNAIKRHPLPPFRRTVGFSATTTVQRADFGISSWPSVIGATVELHIEAEATREGRPDSDTTPTSATAPSSDKATSPAEQDRTP